MPMTLAVLCLLGAILGGQINRAIYRWAWNQRSISPWSKPPEGAAPRTWLDRMPVCGWWLMRRESKIHGTIFWLRPMLIELACGVGLPALYWWEVTVNQWLQPTFVAHALLFALMIIATFIDIDEKTIPDFITVPGTLIALLFAIFVPSSLLPIPPQPVSPILLTTPFDWPAWLNGTEGLAVGLLCWFGWCYALLPKTVFFRRGVFKGIQYLVVSMLRHPLSKWIAGMAIVGAIVISSVWIMWPVSWPALLSSLVGLAFAGGLVWAIRIVSGYVMGVEAMGFGDVTLMAMIGAFFGWQAALMTFFIAPFTSILIATAQWLITGNRHIPFGPFLCAGASIVAIGWVTIWARWGPIFGLGLLVPGIILIAIALMGVLLGLLQILKRLLGFSRNY